MAAQKGFAPVLIIVLVALVVGIYLLKTNSQQYNPILDLGWKTYTNNQAGFSIKHPSNWNVLSEPSPPHDTVRFSGSQGEVLIAWQTSGFHINACNNGYVNLSIPGQHLLGCDNTNPDGQELWGFEIFSENNGDYSGRASAKTPNKKNRQTILKILSTLKIIPTKPNEPKRVVSDFYSSYLGCELSNNDIIWGQISNNISPDDSKLIKCPPLNYYPALDPNLILKLKLTQDFNPLLCSKKMPPFDFQFVTTKVDEASSSGNTSSVNVHTYDGLFKEISIIKTSLTKKNNTWVINDITCATQ